MGQEPKTSSLAAFAGDMKRDMDWLSQQPEWDELLEGYQAGINPATIRRWLIREKGYSDKALPSQESIGRYLRNNHARG